MRVPLALLSLALSACTTDIAVTKHDQDDDGDGFTADIDCDDLHAAINPDADELCDGADNDCDDAVDEDATDAKSWYTDADGDGYGGGDPVIACEGAAGTIEQGGDCDDAAAAVSPAATEVCNGIDDNCNDDVDGFDAEGATAWYADADTDGFGDAAAVADACEAPAGYVADATDCDDASAAVSPLGTESCNSVDDDCDGTVDEAEAVDAPTWYIDRDGDSYGDPDNSLVDCAQPVSYVADASDCNDGNASVSPAHAEVCDGFDDDCDGTIDEADATDALTWYADTDGDTYGDAAVTAPGCTAPAGYLADATDCDDARDDIHPSAAEHCDGVDHDCDGAVDESDAVDTLTWYADTDADTYGDAAVTTAACAAPAGFLADATDCDDARDDIHPGASEYCDGVDHDCDGAVDESDAVDTLTWYADIDGDGYGGSAIVTQSCNQPFAYVAGSDDCDDTEDDIYPGAPELCDSIDHDCDGLVNEDTSTDADAWYTDADGDGFGDPATAVYSCSEVAGLLADGQDCDDTDATINPDAEEVCDGIDNACHGGPDWNLNVPAVYATIQDAVDAASNGDHVCVAAGTYVGGTYTEKRLTLEGYEGSAVTILDGDDAERVLQIEQVSSFTLRGFTITGGNATSAAGLYVHTSTDVDLSDLVVTGNTSSGSGAGLSIANAVVDLSDVRVTDNTGDGVSLGGAGIYVETSLVTATDLWVSGNSVTFTDRCEGGGLYIRDHSVVTLEDTVVADNSCVTTGLSGYVFGAAAEQANSDVSLENVTIVGNTVTTNGTSAYAAGWYYTSDDGETLTAVNVTSSHNTMTGARETIAGAWLIGGLSPSTSFSYSNVYGNEGEDFWGVTDPTETDGNVSVDPGFVDISGSDSSAWDLSLDVGSELIDAGDPSLYDADGSRSDIGAYDGTSVPETCDREAALEAGPESPSVGAGPYSARGADLDGDGWEDLVTVNVGGASVSVLLGNGDGTFAAAVDYAVGRSAVVLAIADLDGDETPDLAVGNYSDQDVSVLLGNGDGTFAAAVDYANGSASPNGMVAADLDADGDVDLALSNNNGTATVLFGAGDGTFGSPLTLTAQSAPLGITAGDFDGDETIDLAVPNYNSHSVSVFLGLGSGAFAAAVNYAVGTSPDAVTAEDLDGDDILDLAVANEGSSTVSVLLGNGDGTFTATGALAADAEPISVSAADVDGDGAADLVVALPDTAVVAVYYGVGDGTFEAQVSFAAGLGCRSGVTGDWNDDGAVDVVTADLHSDDVTVLLGTCEG